MAAGDRKRVLAVEGDARPHGALAVDVVVLVDEDAVAAAEPCARARRASRAARRSGRTTCSGRAVPSPGPGSSRVGVVAERGRDHGAGAREQRLGVAGDLRPARREAHRREQAALLPLADVALGLLVVARPARRRSRRGRAPSPSRVSSAAVMTGLCPCRRCGSMRTAGRRCSGTRRLPIRSPGRARCSCSCARRRSTISTSGCGRGFRRCRSRASSARTAPASGSTPASASSSTRASSTATVITVIGEHTDGTHAELIAVPETQRLPARRRDHFETAAAFPLVYETAYRMLVTKAQLQAGEWVLIWGIGGGVATASFEIARASGRRPSSPRARTRSSRRAREWGADLAVPHADGASRRGEGARRRRPRRRDRRRGDVEGLARGGQGRRTGSSSAAPRAGRIRPRSCIASGGSS